MSTHRLLRGLFLAARVAAGVHALTRLAGTAKPRPPITVLGSDPVAGGVTVVIPARDEALRIGPCLALLRTDPAITAIIVVDDHSTDGTAEVATGYGAVVLTAAALPTGWAGKCWAVQQGVEAARTDWIVALDADTEPAVGLVGALVRRAQVDQIDLLTVAGRFRCRGALLQALHPSLLTTLVYRYGPPGVALPADRALANGQCMTFRRAEFLRAGGFGPVAASLVEDVALARHWAAAGRSVEFLDAGDLLTVTMHTDAGDAWRGWGRSLPLGDVASRAEQASGLAVVWLAQALPLARMVLGRADLLDGVLLVARLGTVVGTRRAYEGPSAGFWLSPLADLPVAWRLTQSTLRPERTWRGRTYPA